MGPAIARAAELLGVPLMPHQRLVADVAGELLDDGRPAFREVVVSLPRQHGKTTLLVAFAVQRAVGWANLLGPQRIVYSAQSGIEARKKLLDDMAPMLRRAKVGVQSVTRGMGIEQISWANGSTLSLLASSEEAGHGRVIDLGIRDELHADVDHRREQVMLPAMVTRTHAQLLSASTAGTASSVVWLRLVERGRAAAAEGRTDGIAYFEWSAPDGVDVLDPEAWPLWMPALGHTIDRAAIEHAAESMPETEFRRAFGNIVAASVQVIPPSAWELVCATDAIASPPVVFGLDVNVDRSAAAIVAVSRTPTPVVELVEFRGGLSWVLPRVRDLASRHGRDWVIDARGPAAVFAAELDRIVDLRQLSASAMAAASAAMFDAVIAERVRVRRHPALDAAVAGAARRITGDTWSWSRRSSHDDICPLVAATCAHAVAVEATDDDLGHAIW